MKKKLKLLVENSKVRRHRILEKQEPLGVGLNGEELEKQREFKYLGLTVEFEVSDRFSEVSNTMRSIISL